MTIQIRKSVFETNSSSSHSLTMGKAELVAQPFSPHVLREGKVTVDMDEYGWEYRRLYTTESKLSYLLTQLGIGGNYGGRLESMEALCESDERAARLVRVVKEHTGCDIVLGHCSGGIDHESVGNGLEVFNSDETLKQFLFSEDSYIQTGNDNSVAPWVMPTDRGTELTYAPHIAEVPDDYVGVKLSVGRNYGCDTFYTAKGAYLADGFNAAMLKKLRALGVMAFVNVKHTGHDHPYRYSDTVQTDWASKVVGAGFKLAGNFNGDVNFIRGEGYETEATLTLMVPPALAKAVKALKKTPKVLVELSDAKNRLKHYQTTAKRAKEIAAERKMVGYKREEWLVEGLKKAREAVAELKAKAQAEGVL